MTGWLIFFAVLAALAILPLGVRICYDTAGFRLGFLVGPIKFWLDLQKCLQDDSPEDAGKDNPPKKVGKRKKQAFCDGGEREAQSPAPLRWEGMERWQSYKPFLRIAAELLGDLRRKVRVRRLDMRLVLAGDDPANTASLYGYAWMLLGSLWPLVQRCFVIRKQNIEIQCDFAADEVLFSLCADITITLGRLLVLAVRYGKRVIQEYWKMKNSNKAVRTNE